MLTGRERLTHKRCATMLKSCLDAHPGPSRPSPNADPVVFADPRPAGFLLAAAQCWTLLAPLPLKAPIKADSQTRHMQSSDDAH
jgi:hypothetical protein